MDMSMAEPDTESHTYIHTEDSITYDLARHRNLSDTWRIDVVEEPDSDADGRLPNALP
jgi:hypothetical protein